MSMAIPVSLLCFAGLAAGLVWLAVCAIRKRPKKRAVILSVVCFVIGVAAFFEIPVPDKSQPVETAQEEASAPAAPAAEKAPQEQLEEICRASLSSGDELRCFLSLV